MAAAPPKYSSVFISLKTSIGSFPDLPKASQKTYWSIMVSPITRIFTFLKASIIMENLGFKKIYHYKSGYSDWIKD